MIPVFIFLFGLALGSFLNVCIYRLPRGESIIHPRSRCLHCQAPIAAYDNIPVVSYLLLGGRCRHCRQPIGRFYPLVELASGVFLLSLYVEQGLSPAFVKNGILGLTLLGLIVTDLRDRILPDRMTFPALGAGLALALWVPVGDGTAERVAARLAGVNLSWRMGSLGDALLGAGVWAGVLYAVREAFYRVRKIEGLGLGDIKMVALLGAYLGLKLTLITILVACVLGIVLGGGFMLLRRKGSRYELPFGTFLGLAGLAALFWGPSLLAWYVELIQRAG